MIGWQRHVRSSPHDQGLLTFPPPRPGCLRCSRSCPLLQHQSLHPHPPHHLRECQRQRDNAGLCAAVSSLRRLISKPSYVISWWVKSGLAESSKDNVAVDLFDQGAINQAGCAGQNQTGILFGCPRMQAHLGGTHQPLQWQRVCQHPGHHPSQWLQHTSQSNHTGVRSSPSYRNSTTLCSRLQVKFMPHNCAMYMLGWVVCAALTPGPRVHKHMHHSLSNHEACHTGRQPLPPCSSWAPGSKRSLLTVQFDQSISRSPVCYLTATKQTNGPFTLHPVYPPALPGPPGPSQATTCKHCMSAVTTMQ